MNSSMMLTGKNGETNIYYIWAKKLFSITILDS